jgi:uncharacterized protein
MIRAFRALLLAGGLVLAAVAHAQTLAPIPPLTSPVVDTTGTLSAAQIAQLEQQALALQQRKGVQLQILVVPTTQPEDVAQYAQRVFDTWKLGREKVDDGVLLLVAKDDRRVRIHPGYGLEGAIPDITAGRIVQEYLVPKFRAGDFAGGISDATAALTRLIDGESLPTPMASHASGDDSDGALVFALFAAFIVASIVRGMFSGMPAVLRGLLTGGAAGGVAWLISSLLPIAVMAGVFGMIYGLITIAGHGRYARDRDWGGFGGGGFGGGGFGGGGSGSGGGWSGGGGMSGGGGASGSW